MMKTNKPMVQEHTGQKRQNGFTLIEILVSIAIGLVILTAVGTAYLNSANLARQRENQSELNEPARIVMRMLQHDVSLAGYVDVFDYNSTNQFQASALYVPGNGDLVNLYQRAPQPATLAAPLTQFFPGLMPVFGCDGAMLNTSNGIMAAPPAVLACGAANATQHTLQVAYQAAPSATPDAIVSLLPPSGTTGEGRDCNQQSLAPAGTQFVINRYFVQPSPANDGTNELYCSGSGNAIPQPIARGVMEFMVRYQVTPPGVTPPLGAPGVAAGGSPGQYVSAADVNPAVPPPGAAVGWANVTAVEVCMVSATAPTSGAAAQGTLALQTTTPTCARDPTGIFSPNNARAVGDQRLWKRYISVISVRNAVYFTPN